MAPAWRSTTNGVLLHVRVTPRGGRDRIEGIETRADGKTVLKLRVRSVPEDGAANDAVLKLLADALDLRRRDCVLQAGATARQKQILLTGDPARLSAALSALVSGF